MMFIIEYMQLQKKNELKHLMLSYFHVYFYRLEADEVCYFHPNDGNIRFSLLEAASFRRHWKTY